MRKRERECELHERGMELERECVLLLCEEWKERKSVCCCFIRDGRNEKECVVM